MRFALSPPSPRLAAALATLALWALVAVSALYWYWRVRTPPLAEAPLAGELAESGRVDPQAVARGLGAPDAHATTGAADMTGRFVLRGVVTHGDDAGAALIAVDGKPPKPVRVGAAVEGADGWTLRAVTASGAVLAGGARELTLAVPQPVAQQDTYSDVRGNPPVNPPVSPPFNPPADARASGMAPVSPTAQSRLMAPRVAPPSVGTGPNGQNGTGGP